MRTGSVWHKEGDSTPALSPDTLRLLLVDVSLKKQRPDYFRTTIFLVVLRPSLVSRT